MILLTSSLYNQPDLPIPNNTLRGKLVKGTVHSVPCHWWILCTRSGDTSVLLAMSRGRSVAYKRYEMKHGTFDEHFECQINPLPVHVFQFIVGSDYIPFTVCVACVLTVSSNLFPLYSNSWSYLRNPFFTLKPKTYYPKVVYPHHPFVLL